MHSGDLTISTDNTVIDGWDIRGLVTVTGKKVTIRNSRISSWSLNSRASLVTMSGSRASLTISRSELFSSVPSKDLDGVTGARVTLDRVNLHDLGTNVVATGGGVTVRDSWLHHNFHVDADAIYPGSPANKDSGAVVSSGSTILFDHNVVEGAHDAVIAVRQADGSVVSGVTLRNNWLSGGTCTVDISQGTGPKIKKVALSYNVFLHTADECAIIADTPSVSQVKLVGNTFVDGSGPVTVTPRA